MGLMRVFSYVMLTWFVISRLGQVHWLLVFAITCVAIANLVVMWLMRRQPNRLAKWCRSNVVRRYVGMVCYFTGEQAPQSQNATSEPAQIRLSSRRDFEIAAFRAKQIVRGMDRMIDEVFHTIFENQTLRRGRKAAANAPLASFLFVGQEGIGKRYLGRVTSKLLYGSAAVEVFDCERVTAGQLLGTKDLHGPLVDSIRKRPHSTVLFENTESAKADVGAIIGQILSTGKLYTPGSKNSIDFQSTTIVLTSTTVGAEAAEIAVGLAGVAHQQRVTDFLRDNTQLDRQILNAVNCVLAFESPSELVKSEVVALILKKECKDYGVTLSHVDPEIVATQVVQMQDGMGFALVPQRIRKLLRRPLVAAQADKHSELSLLVRYSDMQSTVTS